MANVEPTGSPFGPADRRTVVPVQGLQDDNFYIGFKQSTEQQVCKYSFTFTRPSDPFYVSVFEFSAWYHYVPQSGLWAITASTQVGNNVPIGDRYQTQIPQIGQSILYDVIPKTSPGPYLTLNLTVRSTKNRAPYVLTGEWLYSGPDTDECNRQVLTGSSARLDYDVV